MLEVNPDALEIAAILDKERALGEIHGPLHGIPILIKDNIATFDKMNNTAGSYALVGAKVPRDSPTVARLRAAGAIILGKTNLSSWAQYRSDNGSSGWSALGGQCYGARYPCQDPYGSSSGSGVAADAGLAWATLGTETHGSIIMPAQRANCVGIKPTVGLTSRHLVVPISSYQDTVGPIARTVRDAAAILAVIAGPDQWDKSTLGIPFKLLPDYMGATQSVNIAGFRIGIPRNGVQSKITWAPVNETLIMAHFETAAEVLRSLGAEIVDYTNFSDKLVKEHVSSEEDALSDFGKSHESITVASGFATDIASYFSELSHNPHKITNLKEMRDFTRSCPEEDYPNRDTGIWDSIIDQGFDSSDERAHTAHQASLALDNLGGVTGVLDKYGLDALILPSDYAPGWAAAPGLPVVTVPMGVYPMGTPVLKGKRELIAVAPGIPFGLSFMGRRWSEEVLIQLAYAFEQVTRVRERTDVPCHY